MNSESNTLESKSNTLESEFDLVLSELQHYRSQYKLLYLDNIKLKSENANLKFDIDKLKKNYIG